MPHEMMIRIGVREPGKGQRDEWLRDGNSPPVTLDVPAAGRVTLALTGGWSESGTAFCHLSWEAAEEVDLAERKAKRDRILSTVDELDGIASEESLAPIRAYAHSLVPEEPPE